ncbi:MAG: YedE-related selenium metabolism membrane protein [Firmicutes bacterium HGW-Firmicutes-13]|nr:MAG: YedE-related selenium metabolism membrane protein [Firmicutes bacterium HGW-Firmicutes-13]
MNEKRLLALSGAVIGFIGVLLVYLGNAANYGICVACFVRDIAGGLGLHRAEVVQYIRPEIAGVILGAFLIAYFTGEFRSRGGSSPLTRFMLGFIVIVGALIFLGCPLRMVLRLSAGDLNALLGLAGFIAGIYLGVYFLRKGFTLGRNYNLASSNGYVLPVIAVILLIFVIIRPSFIFFSESGPGSLHAPVLASLIAGLIIGVMVQRSRLCMAGGIRDLFIIKDPHLFYGTLALFILALISNLAFGYFKLGFLDQPIAHNDGLWNFIGMFVVGLGSVLLGGCPLRQFIMSSEGDTDAGLTVMGMLMGAAFMHNFGLAASPAGVPENGKYAVVLALLALLVIAFKNLEVSLPAKISKKINF